MRAEIPLHFAPWPPRAIRERFAGGPALCASTVYLRSVQAFLSGSGSRILAPPVMVAGCKGISLG